MGNVHLVTGFAGKPHVTAADHASLFEAAFRSGQFVMNSGNNFKASLISANQVRISDGEMIMQGRFVRINPAAYEDVAIENGAQGYLRNDLIVMRYTRDADTGIESIGLVAIKGQAVAADPADPQHQVGDINDGGNLVNDFPLYRIPLDGLNVGDPIALFTLQPSIYDLYAAYKAATDKSLSQLSANKAPSGYGYGETLKVIDHNVESNFEALLNNELATMGDKQAKQIAFSCGGGLHEGTTYFGTLTRNISGYAVLYGCSADNAKVFKSMTNGVWSAFEWVNPPMVNGVEYRTTERWQGKAVYTMLIDCKAMPNTGIIAIPHIATTGVIRCTGMNSAGDSLPMHYQGKDVHIYSSKGSIYITTNYDASTLTATAQMWYTKD